MNQKSTYLRLLTDEPSMKVDKTIHTRIQNPFSSRLNGQKQSNEEEQEMKTVRIPVPLHEEHPLASESTSYGSAYVGFYYSNTTCSDPDSIGYVSGTTTNMCIAQYTNGQNDDELVFSYSEILTCNSTDWTFVQYEDINCNPKTAYYINKGHVNECAAVTDPPFVGYTMNLIQCTDSPSFPDGLPHSWQVSYIYSSPGCANTNYGYNAIVNGICYDDGDGQSQKTDFPVYTEYQDAKCGKVLDTTILPQSCFATQGNSSAVIISTDSSSSSDGLSGGAIAGIVIGCLIGVGLMAGVVWYLFMNAVPAKTPLAASAAITENPVANKQQPAY